MLLKMEKELFAKLCPVNRWRNQVFKVLKTDKFFHHGVENVDKVMNVRADKTLSRSVVIDI